MILIILILNLFILFSKENDNKFFVNEFDVIYGNIPNENGFNSMFSIRNKTYKMYYDKQGMYFYLQGETSLLKNDYENYFSYGGLFGLKTILIPENNTNYPIKIDLDAGIGFFSLSSNSYQLDFNWLPEYMGYKVAGNINLRYNNFGVVFGYNKFFELPFSETFTIGINFRHISPKDVFD